MTTRVQSVMQRDYPVLRQDMPIRRAIALLLDGDAAAAPVVDDAGKLIGILTQKDCFRPALHASYYQEWTGTVAEQMTCDVVTIDASDDLVAAAESFVASAHRVFPVLGEGRLQGMLSRSDVLRALVRMG